MTRRHQVSAILSCEVDLSGIEWTGSGEWAEKAITDEGERVRSIALSVADAGVFMVGQVFAGHGLIDLDDGFTSADNNLLYQIISGLAARLIYERLIERLGSGRHDRRVTRKTARGMPDGR